MTYHFATSFDNDKFLLRGLALYQSLIDQKIDFVLWVLVMDKRSVDFIERLGLQKITVVHVHEMEDAQLLSIKKERTLREYSLTCKSFFLSFLLTTHPQIDCIVWLDADLYFFSSPHILFNELGDASIGISEHNYAGNQKKMEEHGGIFNAGCIMFRNTSSAHTCLDRWKTQCLEWCKEFSEEGKYGEQIYINEWPHLYPTAVRILKHRGINVAYWNIEQYVFSKKETAVWLHEKATGHAFPLVFYHFSGVTLYKILRRLRILYNRRHITPRAKRWIYNPYEKALGEALELVQQKADAHFATGLITNQTGTFYYKLIRKWLLSHTHALLDKISL